MLKIIDDIELKKLKKFGFKENKDGNWFEKWVDDYFRITILLYDKSISFDCVSDCDVNWTIKLDLIYDLIQSGLVEKVEE